MKMLNQRLLVLPDKPKTETEGGIVLTKANEDAPISGVILNSENPELPIHHRIYFFNYSATIIFLEGKNLFLVPESEVFGIDEGEIDGIQNP